MKQITTWEYTTHRVRTSDGSLVSYLEWLKREQERLKKLGVETEIRQHIISKEDKNHKLIALFRIN